MVLLYTSLLLPMHVWFINNTALSTGGAIYVEIPVPSYKKSCFFQLLDYTIHVDAIINFYNNKAVLAGSVLYGGHITACFLSYPWSFYSSYSVFEAITSIDYNDKLTSQISSDPIFICKCYSNNSSVLPQPCDPPALNFSVYPGQNIQTSFITAGQLYGISPGAVQIYTVDLTVMDVDLLDDSNYYCHTYEIPYAICKETRCYVATQRTLIDNLFVTYNVEVLVTLMDCPPGFVLNASSCQCADVLSHYGFQCNISDQTLRTPSKMWVGLSSENSLAVVDVCPMDYCSNTGTILSNGLDAQCNFNRTGVLCGQCHNELSATFGNSNCKECSNIYLLLLLPFGLMGVLLVFSLYMCKISVSSGTINGFLFYSNVVRIYDSTFLISHSHFYTKLLSMLNAWLSLDLGIDTCFYNGMDNYAKTWLQFIFPVYIFSLVGAIVLAGRYSSKISKLCSNHVVPVLATLILLSYSKILRTIIIIFSPATLHSLNSSLPDSIVWQYDGNVKYFGAKHTPLFIFGLAVTILFIIPYTALLLAAPCLQSKSHWRGLQWVNAMKPLIDSYQAPFKDRYRSFAGAFLAGRFILYLVFTVSSSPSTSLLAVIITVLIYLVVMLVLSVYKKLIVTLIEAFLLFNLILIALCELHGILTSTIIPLFVTSAIICFIFIVFLHAKELTVFKRCKRNSDSSHLVSKIGSDDEVAARGHDDLWPSGNHVLRESLLGSVLQ